MQKMDPRNRRLIATALMLAIALAGCTASSGIERGVTWVNPRGRPGKVLFGYFCGARGETLKAREVRELIRGISVRMPGESTEKKKTEPLDNDGSGKPAIDAARGYGPSVDSGNPGFPFRFARYYSVSGGGKMP